VNESPDPASGVAESQVGAGFQAMATGDWRGARDAFSAVLAVAEVPEALFGLANALFWLGDLAGTIANCEKAYAGFRRRGDPMFAAGAALALVGYNKGYLGNTAAARGWLSRAARIIENEAPELRGELLGATAYVTDDPVESEGLAQRRNDRRDRRVVRIVLTGKGRRLVERILPLRRAEPVGSAVARACVAMFIAAKDRPHINRAISSAQTPHNVA